MKKHEGFRDKIYDDRTGHALGRLASGGWPTVGYGLNLSQEGLTDEEATYLLQNRIRLLFGWFDKKFAWFSGLTPARKAVVASLAYNVGREGFLEFKKLIRALASGDHILAGEEILNSDAGRKLPERYKELKAIMWLGK